MVQWTKHQHCTKAERAPTDTLLSQAHSWYKNASKGQAVASLHKGIHEAL